MKKINCAIGNPTPPIMYPHLPPQGGATNFLIIMMTNTPLFFIIKSPTGSGWLTQAAKLSTGSQGGRQSWNDPPIHRVLQLKVQQARHKVDGGSWQNGAVRQHVQRGSCGHDGIDGEQPTPAIDGAIAGELPAKFFPWDTQLLGPVWPFTTCTKTCTICCSNSYQHIFSVFEREKKKTMEKGYFSHLRQRLVVCFFFNQTVKQEPSQEAKNAERWLIYSIP